MPRMRSTFPWTPEAEARLDRVPAFVRRFVKSRAEDYAREQGAQAVTAEHLQTLARRRFGENGPPVPPFGSALDAASREGEP